MPVRCTDDANVLADSQLSDADGRLEAAASRRRHLDSVLDVSGLDPLGNLSGEEGDTGNSDASGDKQDLHLPKVQEELIEKVAAVGKPTIVVLMAGSAIDLNYAQEKCNGILLAWYPGARGGKAVADLLFGNVSPSGKLPVTFYKDLEGMPEFTDYTMKGRTYRYIEKEPLYPFGYGLTYGDVEVIDGKLMNQVTADSDIEVEVTVENKGNRATEEVVQLYIKDLESPLAVRNHSLCGFKRVFLEPGEKKTLSFTVANRAMTVVDEAGERHIDSRNFKIFAGISQPDDRSRALTGKKPAEINVTLG